MSSSGTRLSSSGPAPPVVFRRGSGSVFPLMAPLLFFKLATASQSDSLSNLPPSSNHIHADATRLARLERVALQHASTQEATHKMLHWVLDLSVTSGQV